MAAQHRTSSPRPASGLPRRRPHKRAGALSPAPWAIAVAVLVAILSPRKVSAQPDDPEGPINPLAIKQQMLSDRIARLEDQLFRLREKLAATEPENARRLAEALRHAGQLEITERIQALSNALHQLDRLAITATEQEKLVQDLEAVLDILLGHSSEDRQRREALRRLAAIKEDLDRIVRDQMQERKAAADRVRGERLSQQIDAALKRIDELIERQRQLMQDGKAGGDRQGAEQQSLLAEDTGSLAKDLEQLASGQDGAQGAGVQDASDELKSGADDMAAAAQQLEQGASEAAQQDQADASEKLKHARHKLENAKRNLGESEGDTAGKQRDLAQQAGELSQRMSEGDAQADGGQQEQTEQSEGPLPGQPNVQRAQQHMQRAADELDKARDEEAIEQQDKALDDLEKAQRELEQNLKQLRDEEQEDVLRSLEARLAEMLAGQVGVNRETGDLAQLAADRFTRNETLKCAELADRQEKLADSSDTCVRLLEEDGTSVVFTQVMRQLSIDMHEIARHLTAEKVGPLTLATQDDVRATLEELLASLKKLREKLGQLGGAAAAAGQSTGSDLVPTSAELRMLKSSQQMINDRTLAAEAARNDGTADESELAALLERSARRQAELAEMARDIQKRAEKEH